MTGNRSHRHTAFKAINRRGALHAGLLGLGGLSLPAFLRQQAGAGETRASDTAVIFLFLHGGPSQLETYDMKRDATREVRGPFHPVSTNVPDLQLCELLPLHAQIADRFTIIRSCTHGDGGHFEAHGRFMSGNPGLKTGTFESTHPQMGAIVGRALKSRVRGVPAAVGMGLVIYQSAFGKYLPGIGNGYWSSAWRPPIVTGNGLPNATLTIDGEHLNDRVNLLRQFDRIRRDTDIHRAMSSMDEFDG